MLKVNPLLCACALALAGASWPINAAESRDLGVVELRTAGSGQIQRLYSFSHALVIGASQYTNGWSRLPGVPGDVAAVARLLQGQGFQVQSLSNPTRSQLDEALRTFANTHGLSPANRLLVYFAGHGHTLTTGVGKKLGYVVPVDAPRPDRDESGFRRMAYSMENFEQLARQIEAKHVLFMFDSCFSGTVFRSRSGVPDAISDKTDKPVRQFITAGDDNQPVPDESIFRRQLERALGADAEADLNGDGYITGTELGSYLEDKVTNYSSRSQTPRWGKLNDPDLDRGDFVFLNASRTASASVVSARSEQRVPLARPAQIAGLSLDDLEREEAARKEWAAWQAQMKQAFDKTAAFSAAADLRVKAWERFLETWSAINPLSDEDEALRKRAQQELKNARSGAAQAPSNLVPAEADRPQAQPTLIDKRYEVLADGGQVRDLQTKLVWQRCSQGQRWTGNSCAGTAQSFTFEEASALARDGWRVPNKTELASLVRKTAGDLPKIHLPAFPNTLGDSYWSSTPSSGGGGCYVYFGDGTLACNHSASLRHPVRLVR